INGKPALLAIDSGAPVSAIAVNRLEYFGVTPARGDENVPKRVHINGKLNPVFIARALQMGSLNLVDEPMVALDLRGSHTAAKLMKEEGIDGIIGADILFPTNAVLDCSAQVLILQLDPDARGGAPGLNYRGFTRVPIEVNANENLYVVGMVNGRRAKLMLDTGAFATLLHQPFVRSMKIPLRETEFTSAGVNVKHRGVQLATISQLSVGSVKLRGSEVGVINLEDYIRGGLLDAKPPVAGLLGAEMLQRHQGIIDFRTKTLYLKH
ncbi:MAG: pepsin/retropepsin-like aspartic protease family protein, partial [Verrucomicrobiota bacterium]|nr:pepsin/retropepsin-like aspartic protease family protein [Verrucomicrobiota bacterium]